MSAIVQKYSKKGIGLGEAQGNLGFSFYVVLSQGKKKKKQASSFKSNIFFCQQWRNFRSQVSDTGKFEYRLFSEISHTWEACLKNTPDYIFMCMHTHTHMHNAALGE